MEGNIIKSKTLEQQNNENTEVLGSDEHFENFVKTDLKEPIKTEEKEHIKTHTALDDLTDTLSQSTQSFDHELEKEDDTELIELDEDIKITKEKETSTGITVTQEDLKRKAGKGLFITVNGIMTTGAALYAAEPTSNFKLDPETRNEIEQGFIDLADVYGWEKGLPSWVPLTVLIVTAYGTMFYQAHKMRVDKKATKLEEANKKRAFMQIVKNQNKDKTEPKTEPKNGIKNIDEISIKTSFDIPKRAGRGAVPKSEKELREIIKAQNLELKKAAKNQKILING